MKIQIVFTGRSYQLGEALPKELTLEPGAQLAQALDKLAEVLPSDRPLPDSCLISVSGKHAGSIGRYQDCPLADGDELVFVAPVAGG